MKYVKVTSIEAEQYDGSETMIDEYKLVGPHNLDLHSHGTYLVNPKYAYIQTTEGRMFLQIGDYIATGVNGEHRAIKEDVFKKTYRPIEDGDEK